MVLDIIYSTFAGLLLLAGFAGCILPIIPGPPIALIGLILAYFSSFSVISGNTLIYSAIAVVVVTVLDLVAPLIFTKRFGGTKYGLYGATIGLVAGLFFGPFGIILGPLIGAFAGELYKDMGDKRKAFRSAWASFAGFMFGTGLKLITVGVLIWIYVASFFNSVIP
ncbi:MAG: DUF456 domain-containing protein [Candidatus Delongbacteria bacterium]